MLGYSTYVDRFASTVQGLEQHVDHLEALGVRYLHLLALLKAREGDSDGGFAVADYLAVEPVLGTMADVERLAAQLRDSRISLCVDLALNHTSDYHHWALAAKAGDPLFRDFYIVVDEETARLREKDLRQVFPRTAPGNFTQVPEMGGWVWTTFYPFQWDLNWANPEVMLAILDTMLRLANHGFEAFRFDSIAFLWKEAGTDSRNRPAAHHIVRALRAALDIAAPQRSLRRRRSFRPLLSHPISAWMKARASRLNAIWSTIIRSWWPDGSPSRKGMRLCRRRSSALTAVFPRARIG
nr:alpha-amylase family glycosyl hydrolase [Sphingobium sp. BYY-5]